jgi:phosphatidylglycerophosphatase A
VSRVKLMIGTAFGLGLLRPAPGTWGSLPPVVLALGVLTGTAGRDGFTHWPVTIAMLALCLVFSIGCIAIGDWAEAHFGRKDPGSIVADEVAGQALALLFLPWRPTMTGQDLWWNLALAGIAFVLFRGFDITKPPPINGLQKLPKGWGVLVDDLVAGVYALIATQLIVRVGLMNVWG